MSYPTKKPNGVLCVTIEKSHFFIPVCNILSRLAQWCSFYLLLSCSISATYPEVCVQYCKWSFSYTSGTYWEKMCCTGITTPVPSCYNQVASFRWLHDCWLQWWNSLCVADGNRYVEMCAGILLMSFFYMF